MMMKTMKIGVIPKMAYKRDGRLAWVDLFCAVWLAIAAQRLFCLVLSCDEWKVQYVIL